MSLCFVLLALSYLLTVAQLIRDRNFKNRCWRAKGEMFILSSTKAEGMFPSLLSSYLISLPFLSLLRLLSLLFGQRH